MAFRFAVTAVLTFLPIFLLLRYFYTRDIHREPRGVLVGTFVRGVLVIIPVIVFGLITSTLRQSSLGVWGDALFLSFVLAAIPEELGKLWVIVGYSARRDCFDEPMDGLVYGATAALGFAALENVLYVSSGGWIVALMRAFTAVPMHAMTGAVLGYGISRARFGRELPMGRLITFISAVLIHGSYNFFLSSANFGGSAGILSPLAILGLLLGAGVVLILAAVWTMRTVRRLRRQQRLPGIEVPNPQPMASAESTDT